MHIYPILVLLINSINVKVCQKMKGFGFSESCDFSPFICHFITSGITEIREKLLKYLPSTFEYDGVKVGVGITIHNSGVHDEDEDDSGTRVKSNNGCAIISDLTVENLVAAIL